MRYRVTPASKRFQDTRDSSWPEFVCSRLLHPANRVDDVRGRRTVTTRKPRLSRRTSPSFRHSARSLGRSPDGWSPSTPPPSNEVFAALTIASDLQARDVADRQTEARPDINRSHSCGLSRSRLRVRPRRLIRGLRPRPVKKDRSRHAGSGQVAGGKPATGRLCQAGLKK